MIEIVKIIKKKNNYLLEIIKNNKKELLKVDEDTIIKNNLLKPRKISNDEFDILNNNLDINKMKLSLLNFISFKQRTKKEAVDYLNKKYDILEEDIEYIISDLETKKYLNDEQYLIGYTNECIRNKKGPLKLINDLSLKGINNIEEYVNNNYTYEIEYNNIKSILEKETKKEIKINKKQFIIKIKQKLIRQGFNFTTINDSLHILEDVFINDEEILNKEIIKVLKKYKNDEKDIKSLKMTKYLLNKGYNLELIKKVIMKYSS